MQVEDANTILARDLNSLSLQERNQVFESIHGVDDVVQETPEMIQRNLIAFQEAVDRIETKKEGSAESSISMSSRSAYLLAKRQNEAYVSDLGFRIMFLRAEGFDARLAVHRMMYYIEEKLSRFGSKQLTKRLTMADLSPQSRTLLVDYGIHQILPARDSAGRAIYLLHADDKPRKIVQENPIASTDLAFYMISAVAEDEETQKRGIISLQIIALLPQLEDLEIIRINSKHGDVSKWCPVQIKANHIWVKSLQHNPFLRKLVEILISPMNKGNRMRTRIHTGSYTELGYQLLTYGFPSDCLPYAFDGDELRTTAHSRWINRRRKKESMLRSRNDFHALDLPGCRDVCLGRGCDSHQHAGNVYMRSLMCTLIEEYRAGNAKHRQQVNRRLIKMVQEGGGRFLMRTTGGWYEEVTDESEVIRKVGGSFRGLLSRTNAEYCQSNIEASGNGVAVKRPRLDASGGLPSAGNGCRSITRPSPNLDLSM